MIYTYFMERLRRVKVSGEVYFINHVEVVQVYVEARRDLRNLLLKIKQHILVSGGALQSGEQKSAGDGGLDQGFHGRVTSPSKFQFML